MLPPNGFSYGGLNRRYEKRKRRLIRLLDPFSALPVDFSTTLRADNWLLRNFCPGSWKCDVEPRHLRVLRMGAEVAPYCDLLTTFRDKVQIADLVVDVMTPQLMQTWDELQSTCHFFKVTPHLRMRTLIRENLTLLSNLDRMRQHMIIHKTYLWHQSAVGAQVAKMSTCTAAQLYKMLDKEPQPMIDAALFGYYREGSIFINLAEVPYGPYSTIRAI